MPSQEHDFRFKDQDFIVRNAWDEHSRKTYSALTYFAPKVLVAMNVDGNRDLRKINAIIVD